MVLLDPWKYRYSEAYQLTQALLAFGQVAGSVLGWVTACKSSSIYPRHTRISCSPFWPRSSG